MRQKPQLSFWQIWNMCFGFLGIQFGFALQNANVSRIFQTLGAEIDELPILWVAAPLTGLIVQPIVGYFSDRTWNRLGRRRPYFLGGAIVASLALLFMPNSPYLWVAAGMLWIMDASINISMEPFRAFVGDNLPKSQRTLGFAMQSFFIGIGAIVASALPWILANWFDVSNTAAAGQIPDSVKWSFYVGGAVFLLAVSYTVFFSKEYSPAEIAEFEEAEEDVAGSDSNEPRTTAQYQKGGVGWLVAGAALCSWIIAQGLDKQLYILAIGAMVFGVIQVVVGHMQSKQKVNNGLYHIIDDLFHMPRVMKQLALVQLFSWFALFAMWIYATAAVTSYHFGSTDVTSQAYNDGADWVGVLFASYNGFAAIAALFIPLLARRLGCRMSHLLNLFIGGVSLISFMLIKDPGWLILPMVGVGIAWASILSLPYALLSDVSAHGEDGCLYGYIQFLYRHTPVNCRLRAWLVVTGVFQWPGYLWPGHWWCDDDTGRFCYLVGRQAR